MCEIVNASDADYIKTSTGFSTAGATFADVELMRKYVGPEVKVKAAGGISSFDDAEEFNKLGESIEKQEQTCSLKKLELTNHLGFELEKAQLDALSTNGVYTGEMFGEALLNDPRYLENELLKPYREGGTRSDNPFVNFYWDYYAQGKPCYTEIKFPTLEETIKFINEHGGVAVLAHPGNNLKGQFELLDEMVNYTKQELNSDVIDQGPLPAAVGVHMGIGGIGYQYIKKYKA